MAEAELRIEGGRTAFEPGEEIEVFASWSTIREPDRVEIRLVWHTVGKGSRDLEVAQTISLDRSRSGQHREHIVLPARPLSYSGKLVSVLWGIELVIPSARKSKRVEIVIGPNGQAIEPGEPEFARA